MDRYECTVCGYVYNPENGDPTHEIPAGTSFDKLPEKWTCPVCGAPKRLFIKKQER
jgi:rubredoxin